MSTFLEEHFQIIQVDVPAPPAADTGQPAVRLIDTEPKITAGNRSVTHTWLIREGTNDRGEPTRTLAVLSTFHVNSRANGFLTTLNEIVETDETMHGRTFTTQAYMPFDAVRIGFEPVARYSAKALSIAAAPTPGPPSWPARTTPPSARSSARSPTPSSSNPLTYWDDT